MTCMSPQVGRKWADQALSPQPVLHQPPWGGRNEGGPHAEQGEEERVAGKGGGSWEGDAPWPMKTEVSVGSLGSHL